MKSTPIAQLRVCVDTGCLRQPDSPPSDKCDIHQKKAVFLALREMAGLEVLGSSSLSVIIGHPGTGKTQIIKILIGALMHHSIVDHFRDGATHPTTLKESANPVITYIDNLDGIRFLISSSQNGAVDQVAKTLLIAIDKHSNDIIVVQ